MREMASWVASEHLKMTLDLNKKLRIKKKKKQKKTHTRKTAMEVPYMVGILFPIITPKLQQPSAQMASF